MEIKDVIADGRKAKVQIEDVAVEEDIFMKTEVPDDGSGLLWAVAMAYLFPVRNDQTSFAEKFERLFGEENVNKSLRIRELLIRLNGGLIYEDSVLRELVTIAFRNRVVDRMMEQEVFPSVALDDFLLMKNETFVTDGTFVELFISTFPSLVPLIDLTKLKPEQLNEKSIKVLQRELDKVLDSEKVHRLIFDSYLNAMRNGCLWAGEHEIRAMQSLLQCQILVFSERNSTYTINNNSVNICLFKAKEIHYDFGLVSPKVVIKAIMKLKYDLAFALVKIGISDVNYRYKNDWTLLHFATLTDDYRNMIKHLVWQGADLKLTTKNDHTPLQMAEYFELEKAIASLQTLTNESTLTIALACHKQNPSSNIGSGEVQTPTLDFEKYLELQPPLINMLFDCPKPNQVHVFNDMLKLARKLVNDIGGHIRLDDINFQYRENDKKELIDWSPLHYAVEIADLGIVKEFVEECKARVDIKDRGGGIPMQRAAKLGHFRVVQYLIEKGANVNSKDNALGSALSYAVRSGNDNIVHFLIENGAEVNTLDKDSISPFHYAFEGGQWQVAKYLLEKGALLTGLSEKQKESVYQQFILGLGQGLQLPRAIYLGNVKLLEKLISENKKNLDKSVFKMYHKLKLLNAPLAPDMSMFLENKVMQAAYFSENRSMERKKLKPNCENIKLRIQLTVNCINALESYSASEIDDIFLFNGKFIAKNMQILKRQLRWTYEILPWEEMQFYLITFLFSYLEPDKVENVAYLVMHKTKLIKYLITFKKELEKVNLENSSMKGQTEFKTREQIRDHIISLNLQFKDLYQDFEHLRDVQSLKRIEEYLKIACAVDLNASSVIGQLAIERALQVIGECLKNTRDSPNLSDNMNEMLLIFAPKNVRNILTVLRDSMSHGETLLKITKKMDGNGKDFKKIQHDLKKLLPEITYISFRRKSSVVKSFLERIISSESVDEIYVDPRPMQFYGICLLENQNYNSCFDKLAKCLSMLKSLIANPTEVQGESFEKIEKFINRKLKNEEIAMRHVKYLYKVERLMGLIRLRRNLGDVQRLARGTLSEFLNVDHVENRNNLNSIFFVVADLRHSFINFDEARQIASHIMRIIKFDAEKIQNIDQFQQLFKNKSKNDHFSISLREIDDKILFFISEFSENVDVRNKIKEEFELNKKDYYVKISLIKFFNNEIVTDETQFRNWMEKISFKLSKKESYSLLYRENDEKRRNNLVRRINRQNPDNSYAKLVKTLSTQNFTNDQCISDEIHKFIRTLGNSNSNDETKLTFMKKFLFENVNIIVKNILIECKSDSDLLILLRTKSDFRAAIEMLMLKITETLGNLQLFETNPTFLDQPIPVLIGKNLRNYLAHGDLLMDLLSIDHLKSIIFHIRSIRNDCSEIDLSVHDKRIGNAKVENITDLERDYRMSLKLLTKQKQLIDAVQKNEIKSLKYLLNGEIELKYRNFNGWTLLFFAAETDNLEIFSFLLKSNTRTSIYYKDKLGFSVLYYLAKFGSLNILKYLIERIKLVDPNVILHQKKSLLHISAEFGHNHVLKFLLEMGIDANVADERNTTPIYYALINNHVDVALSLMKSEADVHFKHPLYASFFHFVVTTGCVEILRLLIDKNVDVNSTNSSSQTPLHLACMHGQLNVVELLLQNRAQVDAVTKYGKTPLHFAAEEGHENIVERLLEHGASVHLLSAIGETALHVAAMHGHLEVVRLLLEKTHVNVKTLFGSTPLYFACAADHRAVVQLLLDDRKTDVNVANKNGVTPLHKVAEMGDVGLIEMLLDRGANVNSAANEGHTPLFMAAQSNTRRVVEVLLRRGADINAGNDEGVTPLEAAMIGRRLDNVHFLLENNATVNVEKAAKVYPLAFEAIDHGYQDVLQILIDKHDIVDYQMDNGKTMLHFAAFLDNSQVVELLLKNKADVKLLDNDGQSALHQAVGFGRKTIVRLMLRMRPDIVDLESGNGFTPLQLASVLGHKDLVDILIGEGANVHFARKEDNWTALHYAAMCGHWSVVERLLEKGASANAETVGQYAPLHVLNRRVTLEDVYYPDDEGHDKSLERVKIAECLIKYGAKVNAIDGDETSPLHWAAINGHHEMIRVLCQNQALLDERDFMDCTALEWAVDKGHIRCMVYLMMFGADTGGSTRKHFTELY